MAFKTNKKQKIKYSTQQLLLQNLIELKKQNSFLRNFLLAMIKGLGNAIGATIIFGTLLFYAQNKLKPQIKHLQNFIKQHIIIETEVQNK